jgi:hypothetical protein
VERASVHCNNIIDVDQGQLPLGAAWPGGRAARSSSPPASATAARSRAPVMERDAEAGLTRHSFT